MTEELLVYYRQVINDLLAKCLISKSKSPWLCSAFDVNKQAEIEQGTSRLAINYKPLNKAFQWIRYPIPNKKDLLNRLHSANVFSKFDIDLSGLLSTRPKNKSLIRIRKLWCLIF